MRVWYQRGVYGELIPEAAEGFRQLCKLWARYDSGKLGDLFVTSIREGSHSPGSYHYSGRAFDIRYPPVALDRTHFGKRFLEMAGPGWDVVYEGTHIHFELGELDG